MKSGSLKEVLLGRAEYLLDMIAFFFPVHTNTQELGRQDSVHLSSLMQRLGQGSSSVSLHITNSCCGPGPGVGGDNVGVRAKRQEGSNVKEA